MLPAVRQLYLFHYFNSIATAVVANFVFLDALFRRLGVDLAQLGLIKGFAVWAPLAINLLAAPLILRLRVDPAVVGWGYVIRMVLPYGFFLMPALTDDPWWLTAGCAAVLTVALIPPSLANNSIAVLCKAHLPPARLGWHMAMLSVLWTVPFYAAAIACGWYVEQRSGSDAGFYRAMLHVFLATTVWQLAATWAILRVPPPPEPPAEAATFGLRLLAAPFRDPAFRPLLIATVALSALAATVTTFLFPYLREAQGLSMPAVTGIEMANAALCAATIPLWGRMADRVGGKNVLRFCLAGTALAVFCLSQRGIGWVVAFAALAWAAAGGVFGAGLTIGRRYLTLSLGDPARSNVYFAAAEFAVGCGMFVGGVLGGQALEALKLFNGPDEPHRHYFVYFGFCAALTLVLGEAVVALLREPHAHVSRTAMAVELFRSLRMSSWKWW